MMGRLLKNASRKEIMIMKMLKLCMIRLNAIACIIMIIIIRSNCQYLRSNNTNSTSAVRLLSATVTDDMKKKPEFFLIGAMKCGTTTLFDFLTSHPEICNDAHKEKHFYDKDEDGYFRGYRYYLSLFQGCDYKKFYLDATPRYIGHDNVPARIKETYPPNILAMKKFLLILREPVSRHYSEYQMRVRVCLKVFDGEDDDDDDKNRYRYTNRKLPNRAPLVRAESNCKKIVSNWKEWSEKGTGRQGDLKVYTFAEWLKSPDGIGEIERGHYLQHIHAWLSNVKRSQLFIVNFVSLVYDTSHTMTNVSRFLGLSHDWGQKATLPTPSTVKPNTVLDCESFDFLDRYYKEKNQNLIGFINNHPDRPKDEPYFPPFNANRAQCVDVNDDKK